MKALHIPLLLSVAMTLALAPTALGDTNQPLWSFKADAPIAKSPAISQDGTILCASTRGTLYAINPDGSKKWDLHLADGPTDAPVITGEGTILISCGDIQLHAVDSNGVPLWKTAFEHNWGNTASVGLDGTVYFPEGGANILHALDKKGAALWRWEGPGQFFAGAAIGADGTVFVGCEDALAAINVDGNERWKIRTPMYVTALAIGYDNAIFAAFQTGELRSIAADGKLRWSFFAKDRIVGSPAIAQDGTVY